MTDWDMKSNIFNKIKITVAVIKKNVDVAKLLGGKVQGGGGLIANKCP